jgi:hypothetical protein
MRRLTIYAGAVCALVVVMVLLGNRSGQSDEAPILDSDGILACETRVSAFIELPDPGYPGDEEVFFSTPREAPEAAYQRFKATGRSDDGPVGELRELDRLTYYVTGGPDETGFGVLRLHIEQRGTRYGLGGWSACEHSIPNDGFSQ